MKVGEGPTRWGAEVTPTFSSIGYLVMGVADQQPSSMASGDQRSLGDLLSSLSFLLTLQCEKFHFPIWHTQGLQDLKLGMIPFCI